MRETARLYRKSLWASADSRVEVWLEKDALAGVIGDVTSETDVPLMVTRGYRLQSVDLGNGGDGRPSDSVGVATRWTWPDAFAGVTVSDLDAVQAAIAAGRWRESSQAKDWAGLAVASVLKLDATNKAHRAKISALLKTWIANGALAVVEGLDAKREKRNFIEAGQSDEDRE